jgi:hypothetical protein
LDAGYPVMTWTVADLTDLLGRHGYAICPVTANRTLHAMGYRYRRSRHDLVHRQDAEAVGSAKHALAELQERGAPARAGFHLVQVWQRRGSPLSVPAAGAGQRRAVFGTLDYATGQLI